jgi:NIPSNAP
MKLTNLQVLALTVAAFGAGSLVTSRLMTPAPVSADANHVFELRVYHSTPGRLGDIVKRFKDDTRKVFEKHDMTSVGYWVPQDAPGKDNLLIYILSHPSREAATKNWAAFRDDPEWKAITARTEANGKIVDHVDSTFMDPTDFSKIK